MNENRIFLKPKIIICNDISCGVVPIDSEIRLWRESVGRILTILSKHADEVVRLFCGLGTKIK
jgi:adenosyl cobinamide kinase/adenosyl cobinamide phosphate guanylyltransferase